MLKMLLDHLKERLFELDPDRYVIDQAVLLMGFYPREMLPDWVEILANGDPAELDAVIDTARADAREVERET